MRVDGLSAPPGVRDVSFDLHEGEILGLGGLVGAGRSETAEVLFGLRRRSGGTVTLSGEPFVPRRPADAIRAGVGFVAEDRRTQSIVPDLSVKENLLLGHLGAHRGFGLAYGKRMAKIEKLLAQLDLPADRLADASLLNFSGGMQQKIIIARWLLLDPKVLILDEPTKGVDIGTRQSIYAILQQIARQGVGVVVISSDFQELIGLCERIIVMSDGYSIASVPSTLLDKEKLTLFAAPRSSMAAHPEAARRPGRRARRHGLLGHPGQGHPVLPDGRGGRTAAPIRDSAPAIRCASRTRASGRHWPGATAASFAIPKAGSAA